MNSNKNPNLHLTQLAQSIGSFIDYWGFRSIQGQIWTVLYLSERPLNCMQITQLLKVSKALVSPALRELECYKLIRINKDDNLKEKKYTANSNVLSVIKTILKTREVMLIRQIEFQFNNLQNAYRKDNQIGLSIDPKRLKSLGLMIVNANTAIRFISSIHTLCNIKQYIRNPTVQRNQQRVGL